MALALSAKSGMLAKNTFREFFGNNALTVRTNPRLRADILLCRDTKVYLRCFTNSLAF